MITRILAPNQADEAGGILAAGGLVVFPTETVYGLGADAGNNHACRAIFAAKGRPVDNPLIVHYHSVEAACAVVADARARTILHAFAPGPITVVVRAPNLITPAARGGLPTLAVRVPDHPIAHAVLAAARTGIAAPSANRSGRPSPTTFEMALAEMDGRVDAIVQGEACRIGLESTVVDTTVSPARVLRPGVISAADIVARCGFAVVETEPHAAAHHAPSPGTRYPHYRPACPVRVVHDERSTRAVAAQLASRPSSIAARVRLFALDAVAAAWGRALEETLRTLRTAHGVHPADDPINEPTVEVIAFPDWEHYRAQLYSELVAAEQAEVAAIVAQLPSVHDRQPALRDRLLRAAHE